MSNTNKFSLLRYNPENSDSDKKYFERLAKMTKWNADERGLSRIFADFLMGHGFNGLKGLGRIFLMEIYWNVNH